MKAKKTNKLTGMKAPEVDNMTNNINEAKKGKIIDAVDTTNFPIQTDTNLSPFFSKQYWGHLEN